VARLGVEKDLVRARGTEGGHDKAVSFLRGQAVLIGEACLDSGGVNLHVARAHVVGNVGVGRDRACERQGVALAVDRSTVVSGASGEVSSNVLLDCLNFLRCWASVVVDDAAISGNSTVVGMGVTRLMLDFDSDVMVLRVWEEVLGDEVGVDLELVLRQPRALVRWVDHQRSVPSFAMLSRLCGDGMPGVLVPSALESLMHGVTLGVSHGGCIDHWASVCLHVEGVMSGVLVTFGVMRPSILAILHGFEADVHMARGMGRMDNVRPAVWASA
jgi:hypothetical protein